MVQLQLLLTICTIVIEKKKQKNTLIQTIRFKIIFLPWIYYVGLSPV